MIAVSVREIGQGAFDGCGSLTIYYVGMAAEWRTVSVAEENAPVFSATVYYYSEATPSDTGRYWHYDESGKPVVW